MGVAGDALARDFFVVVAAEELLGIEGDGPSTDAGLGVGGLSEEQVIEPCAQKTVGIAAAPHVCPRAEPAGPQPKAHAGVVVVAAAHPIPAIPFRVDSLFFAARDVFGERNTDKGRKKGDQIHQGNHRGMSEVGFIGY